MAAALTAALAVGVTVSRVSTGGNIIPPADRAGTPPPGPTLNKAQEQVVHEVLNTSPAKIPPAKPLEALPAIPAAAHAEKKDQVKKPSLHKRQQLLIQNFAPLYYEALCEKLINLLKEDKDLQKQLGIDIDKDSRVDVKDLFKKMKNIINPEGKKIAEDEDFVWINGESDKKITPIYDNFETILNTFNVDIETDECPDVIAEPIRDALKAKIDAYIESKFSLMKLGKKVAPAFGAAWFLVKYANKINGYGGFTFITAAATAALNVLT